MNNLDRLKNMAEQLDADSFEGGYKTGFDDGYDEGYDDFRKHNNWDESVAKAAEPTLWITYKGRSSQGYKFSTTERTHPAMVELKAFVKQRNDDLREFFERYKARVGLPHKSEPEGPWNSQPWDTPDDYRFKRVRQMPRGNGHTFSNWVGLDNAEYFDIYVMNRNP